MFSLVLFFFFSPVSFAFPTYGEWVQDVILNEDSEEVLAQKVPDGLLEDVLSVYHSQKREVFLKLSKSVYFPISGITKMRLLGAYRLEKAADELNLHTVRVPRQLVWYSLKRDQGGLFSEKITPSPDSRQLSFEHLEEIKALFSATGFSDYGRDNVLAGVSAITGQWGIYIVDTGDSFDHRTFSLAHFLFTTDLTRRPGLRQETWEQLVRSEEDEQEQWALESVANTLRTAL